MARPKNHPASVELQNEAIIKRPNFKAGDPLEIPSPLSPTFRLPEGVERIVPLDQQNALLVVGTFDGVARLRTVVEILDRPAHALEFECSAFWLDSLSPEAAGWASETLQLEHVDAAQSNVLETLVQGDRAARFPLPTVRIVGDSTVTATLPFAAGETNPGRDLPRTFPGLKNGDEFYFGMPRLRGGVDIDPEMVMPMSRPMLTTNRTTLRLTPIHDRTNAALNASGRSSLLLRVDMGMQSLLADISQGQTLLLHGSASAFGLQAPSPRFSVLVVRISPRFVPEPQSDTTVLQGLFRTR